MPDEPSRDAVRWAERENERRLAEHQAALHAWAADDGALCDLVERARTPLREGAPAGFPLARGERVVHALRATLVDCPAMPSGTPGWSFRASRRGYPPAVVEPLRPLDVGTAVVTTDRVVFQGAAVQREWRYDHLTAYVHALGAPYTAFADGNGTSGVMYDPHDAPSMHFAIALALAHHGDAAGEFVAALAAERAAVHSSRPADPAVATPAEAPRRRVRTLLRTVFFGPRGSSLLRQTGQGVVTVALAMAALGAAVPQPTDKAASTSAPAPPPVVVATTTTPPPEVQTLVAAPTPTPSRTPSRTPSPRPTTVAPKPTPRPTTAPPKPKAVALSTCGAPSNPWGYNLCGRGSVIGSPPASFCDWFDCIASFWEHTNGYVMRCDDGMYSHSGGRQGSCSSHGGNNRPLYG